MTSTWPGRTDLSRRGALAYLGAGGLALALAGPALAAAQDATPGAIDARHPLIGAWLAVTDDTDPANSTSLFLFTADGSYLQSNPDGSNGLGSWRATDTEGAELTALFVSIDDHGAVNGMTKVRATIQIAADTQSFTAPYTLELLSANGQGSGEYGPATASGKRIAIETMGQPKGPISALLGPGAATPGATPNS